MKPPPVGRGVPDARPVIALRVIPSKHKGPTVMEPCDARAKCSPLTSDEGATGSSPVSPSALLKTSRREIAIGERTLVMGIINATPDSFSDGGRFPSPAMAVEEALRMVDDGADMIDIGGESSRPGSDPVPAA